MKCLPILEKVGFGKKGNKSFLELQSIKALNLKNILYKCKKAGKKLKVIN